MRRRLAAGLAVGGRGRLGVVVIEIVAVTVAVVADPGLVVVRRLLVDVLIGLFR